MPSYTSADMSIRKQQIVKVFDSSGRYLDVMRDAPYLECKENINAAADAVKITLPRAFDAYDGGGQPGSMNTIANGNIVQWWLYGVGLPSTGLLKYQGVINEIAPKMEESGGESVEVTVTPYSQILGDRGVGPTAVTFGTAGSPSTYVDTAVIFKAFFTGSYINRAGATVSVLDPITGAAYGAPYTWDPASLAVTGQNVHFSFKNQKLFSVGNNLLSLSTSAYFARYNQDKTVYFGLIPSNPTHTLLVGQHITAIEYSVSNIPRKNVIVLQGNGVSATSSGSSVATIGERIYLKSDNRITDQNTANLMAAGIRSQMDVETVRAKVKIPDNRGASAGKKGLGYDIETFKVGQTVKILDARAKVNATVGTGGTWGSMVWGTDKWGTGTNQSIWGAFNWGAASWSASAGSIFNQIVTIMSVDYRYHYVELELGARQPTLSRALFDLELRTQDATLV